MNRLRLLDILRGFAILGTLGTNIWLFATLGDFTLFLGGNSKWWEQVDTSMMMIFAFFTNGKFLALLTILFGAGLELKRRKLQKTKGLWPWMYIWTAFLLFLDGLLHYILVFEYDILMSYAVTAIIVSFIVTKSKRVMKWVIGICIGLHLLIVSLLTVSFQMLVKVPALSQELKIEMMEVSALYMTGTWLEQVQMRLTDFWALRSEAIMVLPMNILLFLLGVLFVRSGVFMMDEQGRMKRRKLLIYGLLFGIPLNALTFVPGGFFDISVRYLFAPVLSLGYLGLLAWMLERAEHSFLLSRFEEVGKVALSCYILQNIASSILFYGWGFGLSEHYSGLNTFIIWLAICMLMFMFAHLWLRFFTLGPVEYVWRTLGNLPLKRLKHHHTHTPQ